jgi:hypothetical protein
MRGGITEQSQKDALTVVQDVVRGGDKPGVISSGPSHHRWRGEIRGERCRGGGKGQAGDDV